MNAVVDTLLVLMAFIAVALGVLAPLVIIGVALWETFRDRRN